MTAAVLAPFNMQQPAGGLTLSSQILFEATETSILTVQIPRVQIFQTEFGVNVHKNRNVQKANTEHTCNCVGKDDFNKLEAALRETKFPSCV